MKTWQRPVLWITVSFALLQAAWFLAVPPFGGIDEFDHVYRAASVARGQWVATEPAADGRGYLVAVPPSLVEAAFLQCDDLAYTGPDNCNAVRDGSGGLVYVASSAYGYHPAFYAVVGAAALPFEGTTALYVMRLTAALMCLLFLAIAAWALSRIDPRWPLVGLMIATTPMLLYSTSLPAPNGLEMSSGLALWATLLAIVRSRDGARDGRLFAAAVVSASVLSTLRLFGPFFVLLIVATVALFEWSGFKRALGHDWRRLLLGCTLVGVVTAAAAAWILGPGSVGSNETAVSELSGSAESAVEFPKLTVVVWIFQTIAAFPMRDEMGATVIYPVAFALVSILMVLVLRKGRPRERLATEAALLFAVGLPVLFAAFTTPSRALMWQGRYILPFGVGFVLLAAVVCGSSKVRLPRWAVAVGLSAYGIATVACLLKVRDIELRKGAPSRLDPTWPIPSPWLLALLVTLAMLAMLAALSRRGASYDETVSEREMVLAPDPE